MRECPTLAFVVPCYNEEDILPHTIDTLSLLLDNLKSEGRIARDSFALYVDDGSKDRTWQLLESRHAMDPFCRGVSFATNAGHQNAVWAGMVTAREMGVDCIISLDADLQDDIDAVPEMLSRYVEGCDIVYGVRNDRSSDSLFKRLTAHLFYDLMLCLKVPLIPDHADYRLVARSVLIVLDEIGEQTLFLRALFPSLGFRSGQVFYRRRERIAGESKYPLHKMIQFAIKGVISHTYIPLRFAGAMSFLCILMAFVFVCFSFYKYACGDTIPGWTSMMLAMLLLGSVQLFCLAVIGEYIAKIFTEVRHRPRYVIKQLL